MTKYRIHATRNDALADERRLWGVYYTAECATRGLRAGVDSLDIRRGRVVALTAAVTTTVGVVRAVAGAQLLVVPGAGIDVPDDAALVERDALPQAVRDALDAEENATEPGR